MDRVCAKFGDPSCIGFLPQHAMLAQYLLSSCICLSVTSRESTKMAKRRITQTTPHDSPGTLMSQVLST